MFIICLDAFFGHPTPGIEPGDRIEETLYHADKSRTLTGSYFPELWYS